MSDARIRTIAWADPRPSALAAGQLSGLDFFRKIAAGELPPPPVLTLIDAALVSVREGEVVFSMTSSEMHYNPIGSVHGGVLATLLDSAVGCAVHTALPAGTAYTTLELKVNYIRPARIETGTLFARGTLVHRGRTSAVAEGRITDGADKLIALCSTTCSLFAAGR